MPHVRQYRTPDDYILRDILPECREVGSLARERLSAGLADMNGQADRLQAEAFRRRTDKPPEHPDAFRAVMDALRIGQKHYIALWNLRQAAVNLLATQTFHLFEQHESIYQQHVNSLRKQPIDWKDSKRASALPSASVVQELRLVANASKHGAGPSAVELGFWRSLCERGSLRDEHADRRAAIVRRGPERGSGA